MEGALGLVFSFLSIKEKIAVTTRVSKRWSSTRAYWPSFTDCVRMNREESMRLLNHFELGQISCLTSSHLSFYPEIMHNITSVVLYGIKEWSNLLWPSLTSIKLIGCDCDKILCSSQDESSNIKHLLLSLCSGDRGKFSKLTNLETIVMLSTQDECLTFLKTLRTLNVLNLTCNTANINKLGLLPSNMLTELTFETWSCVDTHFFHHVSRHTGLTKLTLHGVAAWECNNFDLIAQLKHLKKLHLSRCGKVHFSKMKAISELEQLEFLSLDQCEDFFEAELECLASLPRLDTLSLRGLKQFPSGFVHLRNLTDLNMEAKETGQFTQDCVAHVKTVRTQYADNF